MLLEKIRDLRKKVNTVTINPILNSFSDENCSLIEKASNSDNFIKKKKKKLLKIIDKLNVDFSNQYRILYEEFNEAIVYLELKNICRLENVPESKKKTPDFKVTLDNNCEIFLELKTLSYFDGNLNYHDLSHNGLEMMIDLEEQRKRGKRIATSTFSVDPFFRRNKKNDSTSKKLIIELLIDKINQNIKKEQFTNFGNTMLMIDMTQLLVGSKLEESCVAFYLNKTFNSIVSGVLWNVAFGQKDNLILKPIMNQKNNIDGLLAKNGILLQHSFIKGLLFRVSANGGEKKYVGFFRDDIENEPYENFVRKLCEIVNTRNNFYSYILIQKSKKYTT